MASLSAILAGCVLVLARTAAIILSAPVLGQGTGFAAHRLALVVFTTAVLYAVIGAPVEATSIELVLMTLRECLIGIFLGTMLSLSLLAVRVAGELVGQEMGFQIARQIDPTTGVSSTLIMSIYENLFLLVLLALDGHHWILRSLERSFAFAPIGHLELGRGMAETLLAMFAEMCKAGLVFAAPVMIFLLIVSLVIGVLARSVPSLNVMEVGFTLRLLVALGAMFVFAPMLGPALRALQRDLLMWLERGLTAI